MQRVLIVIDSLAESYLFGPLDPLLRKLNEAEFEIHLFNLSDNTEPQHPKFDFVSTHSVERTRFQVEKFRLLSKCINNLKPHIVHAWGSIRCHIATQIAAMGLRATKIFSHFERHSDLGLLQQFLEHRLRTSTEIHVYAHESLLNSSEQLATKLIPNSISTSLQRNGHRHRLLDHLGLDQQDVFLVATVSRLEPRFRVKDLIWAVDLLCCVRQDIHLAIFGVGDWRPLQKFLDQTRASANVHFIDLDSEIFSDLLGIDFYWNAQREQPNPTAMLNCMANEIPTISVLDKETQDLVLPMQTSLATNFGARDEFARWTKYLIEQPESRRKLAQQAKAHVEKLFATEMMVDNYMKIYNES